MRNDLAAAFATASEKATKWSAVAHFGLKLCHDAAKYDCQKAKKLCYREGGHGKNDPHQRA